MSTFQLSWGTILFAITVDVPSIHGIGGPAFPRLLVPINLHFSALDGHELSYEAASAQLALADGTTIAEAATKPFIYTVRNSFPARHQFEFAFDHFRLEKLESLRNAQPFLRLRLDIQTLVQVRKFGPSNCEGLSQEGIHPLAGTGHIEIPSNTWCEKVAPGLGIGLIRVFELPAIPVSEIKDYERAFRSLEKAQQRFTNGDYDDAVAECRKVLEPLRQHLRKIKTIDPKVLPADYADRVGEATTGWLIAMLDKTHGVSSELHHTTQVHFTRLDAQMVLTITMSLVAYILRNRERLNEAP
jgi:hypothetical protein